MHANMTSILMVTSCCGPHRIVASARALLNGRRFLLVFWPSESPQVVTLFFQLMSSIFVVGAVIYATHALPLGILLFENLSARQQPGLASATNPGP
jgi:hypothetical protein